MTDATWKKKPVSHDYTNASNWSPAQVPDATGTATFGPSSIHSILLSDWNEFDLGGWTFAANAGTYTFTISETTVGFFGAGILTKGASKVNINDERLLDFANSSSAGKAHITNHDTSEVLFFDMSTADHASITNNGTVEFLNQSSAGNATITTMKGGTIDLDDSSDGSNARFIVKAGGTLDLSVRNLAHDTINIGSLNGAGTTELGDSHLDLGGLNKSMKLSGLIEDNGLSDSGGLVKVGSGTLTLSHANNAYEGGTAIEGGTLNLAAKGAAGSFFISFAVGDKATLKIENAALDHHAFDNNEINGFAVGDAFDFAGLKFVKGAKATLEGGTELSVKSGHVTDTISLFNFNPDATTFLVKNDGHGGTKVIGVVEAGKGVAHNADPAVHHSQAHEFDARSHAADLFHDFL